MPYELTTLTGAILDAGALCRAARDWTGDASTEGRVLGVWRSDIGTPGRVLVLRAFDDADALARERNRALKSNDPFGTRTLGAELSMETHEVFPFLPPPREGAYGGVFEIRTYHLRPGGLPATLAGWEAALDPARDYTRHLVTNMYALDGPPRITHIWGFEGVDQRTRLRADHYASGLWPPENGPENILRASSVIAVAEPGWPIS